MESLIDIEDFPGRLLHQAALWDNAELMEDLLNGEELSCLNSRDSWGRTPLHAAAMTEGSRCLRILIQSGASLEEPCGPRGDSRTPLHIASEHGHASNVRLLLQSGVSLKAKDAHGLTALDLAERGDHRDVMEALSAAAESLEAQALLNYENFASHLLSTPNTSSLALAVPSGCHGGLYLAAEAGKISLLKEFLSSRTPRSTADIHSVTKYSPLYIAAKRGHLPAVKELLPAFPETLGAFNVEGRCPLHGAALSGVSKVISTLLDFMPPSRVLRDPESPFPVDINATDANGDSPLALCLRCGSLEALKAFLNAKPHPTVWRPLELTGDHLIPAVASRSPPLLSELLFRLQGDLPPGHSSKALHLACVNRDLRMIDLLLRSGAMDKDNRAMLEASSNEAILSKLLSVRAVPDAEGRELPPGTTPVKVDWSDSGGSFSVLRDSWLIEASLKVNPGLKLSPKYPAVALEVISHLDLSKNGLKAAPACLFTSLVNLSYCNLSMNKLEALGGPPDGLHYPLHALEELHLQNNRLESLPGGIFRLPRLNYLDASNNKLSCLPPEAWEAPALVDLNLSFNLLSDLQIVTTPEDGEPVEEALRLPPTLESPSCTQEPLPEASNLPPPILEPQELKRASLWGEALSVLPEEPLAAPGEAPTAPGEALKSLNLSHNSFSVTPRVLSCFAPALQRLNLSYNALEGLTGGWGSLPGGLKYLDLSHNRLSALPGVSKAVSGPLCGRFLLSGSSEPVGACGHRAHGDLKALRSLNLSANALGTLIVDPMAFPALNHLDVSRNDLRDICSEVSGLGGLSVLNLGDNPALRSLPPSLGLLSKLWNLNTSGCGLGEPLASLTASPSCKSSDVISYLRSVLTEAVPYARMKLMVVGEAGIGKTSLLELLRSESGSGGRGVLHWAARMGHGGSPGGSLGLSTVGVDIGDLTLERKGGGPISFRTWDFGGQREYYATHQYFLSRRSLYLVLWRLSDGLQGLRGLSQWLINIQSRAPNSPVLLVGTHYDLVLSEFPSGYLEHLQDTLRRRFILVSDPEKRGLPAVLDSLEVSCVSRHNIRLLANRIYEVCSSLRLPGSRARLLDVKVPGSFLFIEEAVSSLSGELRATGRDPVLPLEAFESALLARRASLGPQIPAAIKFLHENGVLLHYEDATLRDLVFLDPQWLCDLLSHVVTIREINPFAGNGLMRLEDLRLLFKSSAALSINAKSYVVSLLNKFEIGLTLDAHSLLIPSHLPSEEAMTSGRKLRVAVPLRSKGMRGRRSASVPVRSPSGLKPAPLSISAGPADKPPLRRLFLLSYCPSGFWGRLLSRILSDEAFIGILRGYFPLPDGGGCLARALAESKPTWNPWQSGIELKYMKTVVLSLREVIPKSPHNAFPYHAMHLEAPPSTATGGAPEGAPLALETWSSSIIELTLSREVLTLRREGETAAIVEPCPKAVSQLLSRATEILDLLLEDWYPSLGTRFLHTASGKMLVTRVIPCPSCLEDYAAHPSSAKAGGLPGPGDDPLENLLQTPGPPKPAGPPVTAFPLEEVILLNFNSSCPVCERHGGGEGFAELLAPDLAFMDLEPRFRIPPESLNLESGELLGTGSFGSVYKSVLRLPGKGPPTPVAVKLLSPGVKPEGDPLLASVRSYVSARAEISILRSLRHPNILSLLGVVVKPLALVLELAPRGSLEGILKAFRSSGLRLPPEALCAVLLQIARSLEYLHQHHIIYRDLKSENVLVWDFPAPGEARGGPVGVKLADYGISRRVLPCGTKGFGGTEGFMAPEILRHNGEEEYNEKADIFSFGMFTYELLTLREPYRGTEGVKEALLGGSRPPISPRETAFPLNVLDIMTASWAAQPRLRPSSSQLVSILSAPEFPRLLDAVSLGPGGSSPAQIHCEGAWISTDSSFEPVSTLRVLSFSGNKWKSASRFKETFRETITALGAVDGAVWAGDNGGNLLSFNPKDYSLNFRYKLDDSPVRAILSLPGRSRAVVGLHNGRLFLLDSGVTPEEPSGAEGLFILSELGSSSCIHSLAVSQGSLWAGCSHGSLCVFPYTSSGVFTAQVVLNHFNPIRENLHVLGLLSYESCVFSSLYPGSSVYQWDAGGDRSIRRTLDVSRLLPVSESLRSLSGSQGYNPGKCTISALGLCGRLLLLGTNLGCLVFVEPGPLQPLSVCRPFAASVQALLPLGNLFLSLGRGYRALIPRYVGTGPGGEPREPEEDTEEDEETEDGLFALLWDAASHPGSS